MSVSWTDFAVVPDTAAVTMMEDVPGGVGVTGVVFELLPLEQPLTLNTAKANTSSGSSLPRLLSKPIQMNAQSARTEGA